MVPYGMVAVSISTTAFPIFSKYFASKQYDEMLHSFMDKLKIENDLIPNTVLCLHFDGEDMWLGTKNGIRKIKFKNMILPDFS